MKLLAALFIVFANAEEGITGPRLLQTLMDDYPELAPAMNALGNWPYAVTPEVLASVYVGGDIGFTEYDPAEHFDDMVQQGGTIAWINRKQMQRGDPANIEYADVITDIYESESNDLTSTTVVYKPLM
jgi:hypothetical protein